MSSSPTSPLLSPTSSTPSRIKKFACGAVLLSETCERLAFYSLLGTLVPFLQTQVSSSSTGHKQQGIDWYPAVNAAFLFQAIAYIFAVLAGWITDRFFGKFRSILIFFIFYLLGYIMWTYASWCQGDSHQLFCPTHKGNSTDGLNDVFGNMATYNKVLMPLALVLIAVGVGGVKSSIAPFGADQVRRSGPRSTRTFFNYFYWCINVGSLIALGGVALIQQEYSYTVGYFIAVVALVTSVAVLLVGRIMNTFIRKPPGGSPMGTVWKVFCQACRRSCHSRSEVEVQTYGYNRADPGSSSPPRCLDLAKVQYGGSFHEATVDDTKTLSKILIIFLVLLPYWIVYFQMETTFVEQGVNMRLELNCDRRGRNSSESKKDFQVPVAWLSLFDVVMLVLLIPLFDRLIYPHLDKKGYSPSLSMRIVTGMFFGVLSLACAGFVESRRYGYFVANQTCHQTMSDKHFHVADMSVLWQIPQYSLMALSELFTGIAGLELAYSAAPKYMHTIIMGFFLFSQGIGCFLGNLTIYAFHLIFNKLGDVTHPCFNCSLHLSCYYYTLAFLQVLGIFLFVPISRKLDVGWRVPLSRAATPSPRQVVSGHRFYNATDGNIHTSVISNGNRIHVQSHLTRRTSTSPGTSSDEDS